MKTISIVSPCFNEEENITEIYQKILKNFAIYKDKYELEIIFIDNHSNDNTRKIIRDICKDDNRVKAIFNAQNFGHIRSPYYGLIQSSGDAAILIASDLQDPPELIPEFIKNWEEGHKIIIATKNKADEGFLMYAIRKAFYRFLCSISNTKLIRQFTGFGLYDKEFINTLRNLNDPYPFFRGIIAELGFDYKTIDFRQPKRKRGLTKNNFNTLYDMAMLGITSYSNKPLRFATKYGFLFSSLFSITLIILSILKYYPGYNLDFYIIATIIFLVGAVNIFFIGIVGEYVAMINTRVINRPLVIVEEKINFNEVKNDGK